MDDSEWLWNVLRFETEKLRKTTRAIVINKNLFDVGITNEYRNKLTKGLIMNINEYERALANALNAEAHFRMAVCDLRDTAGEGVHGTIDRIVQDLSCGIEHEVLLMQSIIPGTQASLLAQIHRETRYCAMRDAIREWIRLIKGE